MYGNMRLPVFRLCTCLFSFLKMRIKVIICIPRVDSILTFSGRRSSKTSRMTKWKENFIDNSISRQSLYSWLIFCFPFITCMRVVYACLSQIIRDFLTQKKEPQVEGYWLYWPGCQPGPRLVHVSWRLIRRPGDLPWADAGWHLPEDVSWRHLFTSLFCTRLKRFLPAVPSGVKLPFANKTMLLF